MINTSFAAGGTLDTVVNTMVDNARRKLVVASLKTNALMAWAFATGRVETENGGANITQPMLMGRNPNIASYQYYDELPLGQTNEFATLGYPWARVAGTLIISQQEVDENTGPNALTKILEGKLTALEESIGEKFNEYLFGAGGGTDPLGLASLIPDDPTTGTLGGMSRAVETQWRTSAYNYNGALDPTNIEEAFDDVLLDLKLKADKPDLILIGRNIYRMYRQAVRDKLTIPFNATGGGKTMMDLGFEGISHNGIPMIFDEDCPPNKAYFINSKYLRTHILKGVNMRRTDLAAPWTVDAMGKRVTWQGQFALWRAYRTHAVLRNG